ncbi:hypothetical protein C8R44DRAFT_931028 [Mycena epipterygia]|nr:hypothetical protein C8R44DRAFT_931028 [Mycena epipterygia]
MSAVSTYLSRSTTHPCAARLCGYFAARLFFFRIAPRKQRLRRARHQRRRRRTHARNVSSPLLRSIPRLHSTPPHRPRAARADTPAEAARMAARSPSLPLCALLLLASLRLRLPVESSRALKSTCDSCLASARVRQALYDSPAIARRNTCAAQRGVLRESAPASPRESSTAAFAAHSSPRKSSVSSYASDSSARLCCCRPARLLPVARDHHLPQSPATTSARLDRTQQQRRCALEQRCHVERPSMCRIRSYSARPARGIAQLRRGEADRHGFASVDAEGVEIRCTRNEILSVGIPCDVSASAYELGTLGKPHQTAYWKPCDSFSMCDTVPTLQTPGPIISETQYLVSGTTFGYYICLAFACASPAIYAAHHQIPSKKLARLEDAIKVAEGILKGAKEDCAPRHHAELLDLEGRLLQAEFSASEIQSQMLKAGGVTLLESNAVLDRSLSARIAACYGSLKKYLQNTRGMMKSINKCKKEVEEIRTSTLRIIQEERRHKLVKEIKEVRDVTEVLRSPTHHVRTVRHRGQSSAGGLFQEPYM